MPANGEISKSQAGARQDVGGGNDGTVLGMDNEIVPAAVTGTTANCWNR
jgi:hypothetical protein